MVKILALLLLLGAPKPVRANTQIQDSIEYLWNSGIVGVYTIATGISIAGHYAKLLSKGNPPERWWPNRSQLVAITLFTNMCVISTTLLKAKSSDATFYESQAKRMKLTL